MVREPWLGWKPDRFDFVTVGESKGYYIKFRVLGVADGTFQLSAATLRDPAPPDFIEALLSVGPPVTQRNSDRLTRILVYRNSHTRTESPFPDPLKQSRMMFGIKL